MLQFPLILPKPKQKIFNDLLDLSSFYITSHILLNEQFSEKNREKELEELIYLHANNNDNIAKHLLKITNALMDITLFVHQNARDYLYTVSDDRSCPLSMVEQQYLKIFVIQNALQDVYVELYRDLALPVASSITTNQSRKRFCEQFATTYSNAISEFLIFIVNSAKVKYLEFKERLQRSCISMAIEICSPPTTNFKSH